jgi:hypothetical protein
VVSRQYHSDDCRVACVGIERYDVVNGITFSEQLLAHDKSTLNVRQPMTAHHPFGNLAIVRHGLALSVSRLLDISWPQPDTGLAPPLASLGRTDGCRRPADPRG